MRILYTRHIGCIYHAAVLNVVNSMLYLFPHDDLLRDKHDND